MWSVCNLECAHCYVASSPRNRRLEALSLSEIRPFLSEAERLGVRHIYFTGGEPFLNSEIMPILAESIRTAPVTVLTNATRPIERHLDELARLPRDRVTLRVSLDHFEEAKHDAIRGGGTFARTAENIRELIRRGLRTIVTSTPVVFEDTPVTREEAIEAYRKLFGEGVEVKIIPFTLRMGAEVERSGPSGPAPFLSERMMRTARPEDFQCRSSRCVQKVEGRIRVYPCPIIYDDPDYELGATLTESFGPVSLGHAACYYFCYKAGGRCGDDRPPLEAF